ncbi:MAG: hypothetical protein RL033_1405, partial [Pseudomonadota bacterium]
LWSLAIIACECLTGQQPFPGLALGELVVQICTEQPRVPSNLGVVPPGFDEWFRRGTSRDPAERFASAREMADTLSAILGASAAQQPATRAHAGTSGSLDPQQSVPLHSASLRAVTVPLRRPAPGESSSVLHRAVNAADPPGPHESSRPQLGPHGLRALRPSQRWLVPGFAMFGVALWFWFGASRPVSGLAQERTAVAAPPSQEEQRLTPAAAAPAPAAVALPAVPNPEREAAPAAVAADTTAAAADPAPQVQPVVVSPAPGEPRVAIARASTPSSPRRGANKPAMPTRTTLAKVRPLPAPTAAVPSAAVPSAAVPSAAVPSAVVPSAAVPSPSEGSKRTAIDPFSERL